MDPLPASGSSLPFTLGPAALAEHLARGGATVFPTDTLPALASQPLAAAQIWRLKQRPEGKPLILMGADAEPLFAALHQPLQPAWLEMAGRCWPGAVTLVLPASGPIVEALQPSAPQQGISLGLRIPACAPALDLLRRTGPLATTSANRSGEPPCRTPAEVAAVFSGLPILAPLPWPSMAGQASTVLRWHPGDGWEVLRRGAVVPINSAP